MDSWIEWVALFVAIALFSLLKNVIGGLFQILGSPIHEAVLSGEKEKVEKSLKKGADVNGLDTHGLTPLHHAFSNKHMEIAKYLIENGADLGVTSADGTTLAQWVNSDIFDEMMGKDCDFSQLLLNGRTYLHLAVELGLEKQFNRYVAGGLDINAQDNSGTTPLISAILAGQPELAFKLISAGADVCIQNEKETTALIAAASKGYDSLIKKLLERGAYCVTASGWTPLHLAAVTGNTPAVEGLLSAGIDGKIKDEMGLTAKDWAINEGHSKTAAILP